MKITVERLKRLRACKAQVARFAELFPDGVEVTEELCIQHAQDFDWRWGSRNLLSPLALAAYDNAVAPARADYDNAVARAWARAHYDNAVARAWADYEKAATQVRADYEKAGAVAFAKAAVS